MKRALGMICGTVLIAAIGATGYFAATAQPAPAHQYFAARAPVTEVIAHRGGAGLRPENTLAAFANAVDLGVDILEMDVRLTSDGELVVIHDATVDRTTAGSGAVSGMTLAQVQALDAGYRFSADGGASHPYRGLGIRIPALKEVFAAHGAMRMVVEMKSYGDPTAAALCARVRSAGMARKVLVAAFDVPTVEAFRRRCPEVATAMNAAEARAFVIAALAFLAGVTSPPVSALLLPDHLGSYEIVDGRLIAAARARGMHVQVWSVNDEARMRELLQLRIDGIMTDRPDRLLALRGASEGRSK